MLLGASRHSVPLRAWTEPGLESRHQVHEIRDLRFKYMLESLGLTQTQAQTMGLRLKLPGHTDPVDVSIPKGFAGMKDLLAMSLQYYVLHCPGITHVILAGTRRQLERGAKQGWAGYVEREWTIKLARRVPETRESRANEVKQHESTPQGLKSTPRLRRLS
jgi:hypothetical protein